MTGILHAETRGVAEGWDKIFFSAATAPSSHHLTRMMSASASADEDDDFLDDLLDDFAAPAPASTVSVAASAPSAGHDASSAAENGAAVDDSDAQAEFERQLRLGMEQLLTGFAANNGDDSVTNTVEALLGSLKNTPSIPSATTHATSTSAAKEAPKHFSDLVSDTLSNLNDSSKKVEDQLNDQEAVSGEEDMEAMMKELEEMMGSAEFEDMFSGVMGSLMSRDLLYEPMKDLALKYPEYLDANASTISDDDMTRYRAQEKLIVEILAVYDDPAVTGDEEGARVGVLMQKMQEYGNPPEGVLGDMASLPEGTTAGLPGFPFPGMGGAGGEANPECSVM
ncbi:Pex19 protein family-domain-containing protein [Chytriomyces sp. MP71]|nr:Pex19 protein family-domain-containing protein [Chytriomyces sp. MP71]